MLIYSGLYSFGNFSIPSIAVGAKLHPNNIKICYTFYADPAVAGCASCHLFAWSNVKIFGFLLI